MHPARRLGAALGFVSFFAAYFLPFISAQGAPWLDLSIGQSIYGVTISALEKLSTQANPSVPTLLAAGAMMIVAGGAFGVRPAAGAALGIAGMVSATLGIYSQSPAGDFPITGSGLGYWVLWGTALATLSLFVWMWSGERGPREKKPAKGWSK